MPPTDFQGSSSPFASIGRSILSIRREQVHSMDASSQERELDTFQRHVSELFHDLAASAPAPGDPLLSLSWLSKLLNAFHSAQEEFRVLLLNTRPLLSRPPLDRLLADFFDRAVKALDVCNAVRDGLDHLRASRRHLDIVAAALHHHPAPLGDGHLRRARKALADLALAMLDDKDAGAASSSFLAHRNRSFGRGAKDPLARARAAGSHYRSLSWSVSRSWSAARQLQALGNNLSAPRGNEVAATGGLAVPLYTMNSVLLFVMWALVAAIPCQDRGLQTHFSAPRSFAWAVPLLSLHERILEESKKRDRKNSAGLLREIHQIGECTRHLMELTDAARFPLADDKEAEIRRAAQELAALSDAMKEGLDSLERQVREVFHGIVRSRTEGLDYLSHNAE